MRRSRPLSLPSLGELTSILPPSSRLRAESDDAKVETEWRDLRKPAAGAEGASRSVPSPPSRPRSPTPDAHNLPLPPSLFRPSRSRAGMTDPPDDPHEFISVTLEAKDVLKFLASYSVASTTIACASLALASPSSSSSRGRADAPVVPLHRLLQSARGHLLRLRRRRARLVGRSRVRRCPHLLRAGSAARRRRLGAAGRPGGARGGRA